MSKIKHFFTRKISLGELDVDTASPRSNCPQTAPIPRIVVPVGDPAGIGMEVVLKAMAKVSPDYAVTLVGTRILLEQTYEKLSKLSPCSLADPANLDIINVDLGITIPQEITLGVGNAASGAMSFVYLERAIAATLEGDFQAIVTAPIAKAAWKLAGHNYPGQTEVLAAAAGVDRYGMLFVARSPHTGWQLRTLLATTHISLAQVPTALTPSLMSQKLELLLECLHQDFGISQPRIAIAGLNPHSGEAGQMGTEELDWLNPWLQTQRLKYPQVTLEGLFPPDTLWVKPGMAWYGQGYETSQNSSIKAHDAYLALYHDQGLIPVKLMAFDRAINTTIGLPFVRTSPDHGTAFDIAGQGIADARSMTAALDLAGELVKTKTS